jgi:hypothetical protein
MLTLVTDLVDGVKADLKGFYSKCVGDKNIAGDLLPFAHYASPVRPAIAAYAAASGTYVGDRS